MDSLFIVLIQNTSHPLTNPNDNIQNLIYADLGSSTRATGTNALRPLDDDQVLYAQIEYQSVGDEISLHDQPRTDPDGNFESLMYMYGDTFVTETGVKHSYMHFSFWRVVILLQEFHNHGSAHAHLN